MSGIGASAKATATISETPAVNNKTRLSGSIKSSTPDHAVSACVAAVANHHPSAAPATTITRLSWSNCRNRVRLSAPRA
jgi:hypothetical protein